MKRIGNIYNKIYNINNLLLADKKARRCKPNRKDIQEFDKNKMDNLNNLSILLKENKYKTSEYYRFIIYNPKEREIFKLPYYPDRIIHHAIMNIIEEFIVKVFIANTYNCIKNRGIHKALFDLNEVLKDKQGTRYCLKLDIRKFYPNINHQILKDLLYRKFKDKEFLNLISEIIDSTEGVPIGNYLSQYFANFYLTYFDHWIKETLKIKYYFRYCDDIVILSDSKNELHKVLSLIREYLKDKLKLQIKDNYQIFPVESRGIDFVGYKSFHDYILLRKSIKKRFIKMIKTNKNVKSLASYNGWLVHCNSINLRRKYTNYGQTRSSNKSKKT